MFDPIQGLKYQLSSCVFSTGLGSTSHTQQPAVIEKFDPIWGRIFHQ